MKWNYFTFIFLLLYSCNRIETSNTLGEADIKYIQSLGLLDKDEKVYKFYSELRKRNAGNFFTNKRIAKYWIDDRKKEKNRIWSAFYPDIKSIDTVYNPGLTYCPYMLVTKVDNTQFKVCADSKREDIQSFFEDAMKLWAQHKTSTQQ